MERRTAGKKPLRSYVISLDNRKARGSGHERREEILAAARELFLEHGLESVSTRQIATRVGISQTALYVYFKNKEEMLDKLVEAAFSKLGEILDRIEARCGNPLDYLREALPEYIHFGLNNPDEYRLAFILRDGRHKAAHPSQQQQPNLGLRIFATLDNQVASGFAKGLFWSADGSARGIAQSLWASIHGLVALLLAYPDFSWIPVTEMIAVHTDMLLRGLIAHQTVAASRPPIASPLLDAKPKQKARSRKFS